MEIVYLSCVLGFRWNARVLLTLPYLCNGPERRKKQRRLGATSYFRLFCAVTGDLKPWKMDL